MHRQWYFQDADGVCRWHDYPQSAAKHCGQTYSGSKPLVSIAAAAVHPNQVKEARERMKTLGLTGVDYNNDGSCVFTSRGDCGRRGYLKAMSMHDNAGGYGDG